MMAYERTPSHRLEPETAEALRGVMNRAVARGDHSDELHDVLCRAAAEAREKGIQAEQLLVIMKDLWNSLPELRRVTGSERQTELLQELISRCIERYYDS
jgi:hypothetical protein